MASYDRFLDVAAEIISGKPVLDRFRPGRHHHHHPGIIYMYFRYPAVNDTGEIPKESLANICPLF